jgi:hypothetical protein
MKKRIFTVFLFFFLAVTIMFISMSGAILKNDQEESDKIPIPENLYQIFQRSCKPCHWPGGKFKAMYHVNFSKWDSYSLNQQLRKAEKICRELQGEDMPPNSMRKAKPELIPTDEQVDAICRWSSDINKRK